MTDALKAEFKKLVTIRSTYVMAIILLLFIGLISVVMAYSNVGAFNPNAIKDALIGSAQLVGTIVGIASVLILSHEYRYNTIVYTLTSAKDRAYVFLSKIAIVIALSIVFLAASSFVAVAGTYVGAALKGYRLIDQNFSIMTILAHSLPYTIGTGLAGLLFVFLTKNQILSIVLLFIVGMVEGMLSFLLKSNAKYLPFTALGQVLQDGTANFFGDGKPLSNLQAISVYAAYMLVGFGVAWYLFSTKDAN